MKEKIHIDYNVIKSKYIKFKEYLYRTNIMNIFFILFHPLVLFIMLEGIKQITINRAFSYVLALFVVIPSSVLISYIILLSFTLFVRSFSKNVFWTNLITSIVTILISVISYYKFISTSQPLYPGDIFLYRNAFEISSFGNFKLNPLILIAVGIIALFLVWQYTFLQKQETYKKQRKYFTFDRLILLIISVIIIYYTCFNPKRYDFYKNYNFQISKYDTSGMYIKLGGIPTFFIMLGELVVEQPENYNKQLITDIKNNVQISENNEDTIKPNVIAIMYEALSDPTILSNVSISEDPLKNIRELSNTNISGNMVTPVLGGGTSIPEFEFLTGLSTYFLGGNIYPFVQHIQTDMNSLVRNYRNNGYYCIGIHSNSGRFYNREKAYKLLGFNDYISSEDMGKIPEKRNLGSDEATINQIIKYFSEIDGSKFIFAVTIQNHMPYKYELYDEYDISLESEVLTEEEIGGLTAYVQGVYDSDKSLKKLTSYLSNIDEPTIVILFGDHLPIINNSYEIYEKNNIVKSDEDISLNLEMHKTPYLIWSNYDIEDKELYNNKLLSANNLGLQVSKLSNIDIPWYYSALEEIYSKFPVITNNFLIDSYGNEYKDFPEEYRNLETNFKVLQYDLLLKKKYIEINR